MIREPHHASGPRDPIAAVTHADPYPYYAELVAQRPLHRDDAVGLWVASSAAAVTAVLTSDACRVRPLAEPVPKALVGSPAGEIFGHLVRMNDGEAHAACKHAVSVTLTAVDARRARESSTACAHTLAAALKPETDGGRLDDFVFQLPVRVVATLLGIADDALDRTTVWVADFVRCLAPSSPPEQIERGKVAAGHLLGMVRATLTASSGDGLLFTLAREARRAGRDDVDAIVANGIGFLSQTYEATAGLIGNTLLALGDERDVRERAAADPSTLAAVVDEVLRFDPPIQNTRRFLARDAIVAGVSMKATDAILVVLAAANRDPAMNPAPERFDVSRTDRRLFTFGAGVHACPGDALAKTIAAAGVEALLRSGLALERLRERMRYRPSANARIPLFGAAAAPAR